MRNANAERKGEGNVAKVGMVMIAGLTGVFVCMTVLYCAVRVASEAVERIAAMKAAPPEADIDKGA